MSWLFPTEFYTGLLDLESRLASLPVEEISFLAESRMSLRQQKITEVVQATLASLPDVERSRGEAEFLGLGPIEALMRQEHVSEILVNGWDNLWIENAGKLERYPDRFISPQSYRLALEKICDQCHNHLSVERPVAHGNMQGFRVQIVGAELTQNQSLLSLRRHPSNPWSLSRLQEHGWALPEALEHLRTWIDEQLNFLVVGPTGAGKTSIVNACLQELPGNCRALILEDTRELQPPNRVSQAFLTRQDPQNILPEISMAELVRQSLRLRPDRLVLGEIRSVEAKDFLMALSTGHAGSFGTLHASNAHQALIRLEMLIQLGAPNWSLSAIRRLIYLSLHGIIVVSKTPTGDRRLRGLYRISSLEENGFLIDTEWERT